MDYALRNGLYACAALLTVAGATLDIDRRECVPNPVCASWSPMLALHYLNMANDQVEPYFLKRLHRPVRCVECNTPTLVVASASPLKLNSCPACQINNNLLCTTVRLRISHASLCDPAAVDDYRKYVKPHSLAPGLVVGPLQHEAPAVATMFCTLLEPFSPMRSAMFAKSYTTTALTLLLIAQRWRSAGTAFPVEYVDHITSFLADNHRQEIWDGEVIVL